MSSSAGAPRLAWALWALSLLCLAATAWLDGLLRPAGLPELVWLAPGSAPSVVATLAAATVGRWWPAAAQRTRSAGCCWPWGCRCRRAACSRATGGRGWWARAAAGASVVFVLGSVVNPLPLHPEYPGIGNPIGVQALAEPPLPLIAPVSGVVVLATLLAGAWSLVGRFRRAQLRERQQLRWLAWGPSWPRWPCWWPSPR